MTSGDASRRASVASSSDLSFPDSNAAAKVIPQKDKVAGVAKMKKSVAKKTKDTESNGGNTSPNSPLINGSSAKPSEDRPVCKHCKKPVDSVHYDSHVSVCLEKKTEAARKKKERKEARAAEAAAAKAKEQSTGADKEKDSKSANASTAGQDTADGDKASVNGDAASTAPSSQIGSGVKKPPKKAATKTAPGDKKTKKRKADGDGAEKEPKKKKSKKEEEKAAGPKAPKPPKPKGPVNVEIQCGVPLDPEKGGYCARSLTCKSHSMGLKRAVPGRSLPYDQLLANYQKKNQAKQQKALLEAQSTINAADDDDADGAAVDSDEEKDAVMKGLSRWRPRPLEQVTTVGVGRRYRYIRLKEALGSALAGTVGGGQRLFGVPATSAAQLAGGDPHFDGGGGADVGLEAPSRAMSVASEGGRKGSIASAGGGGGGSGGGPNAAKGVAVPVRKGSVAGSVGAG